MITTRFVNVELLTTVRVELLADHVLSPSSTAFVFIFIFAITVAYYCIYDCAQDSDVINMTS